jgi:hypothetical protein
MVWRIAWQGMAVHGSISLYHNLHYEAWSYGYWSSTQVGDVE